MEISIKFKSGEERRLKVLHITDKPEDANIYNLIPLTGGAVLMKLELKNNSFEIIYKFPDIDEDEIALKEKLDELLLLINPVEASLGTEDSETDDETSNPYDPEKIRVDTKPFSLRQIYDMMKMDDIDLAPDFQRNLVWNELRKSRLIESILLRIPLPMFYFAQDDDGKISVVDGLQRLSAIRDFMDNKFPLNNLEYLQKKCGGKFFTHKDPAQAIEAKYFRWLNMTQIVVNVIDPSSPFKLKYDIFRRINTGGQPLNAQEIRNCLAGKNLRSALREMAALDSFMIATGGSVKDVRMEAQELALRFILFHKKFQADRSLNNYSGNIESELNTLTEQYNREKNFDFAIYLDLFDHAMKNAAYLFGDYSFRKCLLEHLRPGVRRQLINKALFVSWSVLLSQYDHEMVKAKNEPGSFAKPLATKITEDLQLLNYLSYGTNSKANIQAAFAATNQIIKTNINLNEANLFKYSPVKF